MSTGLIPLFSYVLISTFTPGPSNISSASVAVLHGYKNTLRYQGGLAAGVFFVMLLSGWISATLLSIFPVLEPVLRYVGAGYILYLAFGILNASYTFADQNAKPLGMVHGLMLQVWNPKLIVYAFTLFSAFLAPMTNNVALVGLAALLLAATSFGATSVWAIFGTAIKAYLHNPRLKAVVNLLLSLSLVYTAIALTGLV
jgi:cysteine/O-acetylserine efflux protein